jgi:integrase/recombinase XerD
VGFKEAYQKLSQKVTLANRSESTLLNYGRQVAHLSLHFNCLPEDLLEEQIEDYLAGLAQLPSSPSRSTFKHCVYGLRFYFRLIGLPKRSIALPSIKASKKLPVVLNRSECKALFKAPHLLRHRIMLCLIYSAGLRVGELCRLRISEVDFERQLIHIRETKGQKSRYVPLSLLIAKGLKQYLQAEQPHHFLFNGKVYGSPYSAKAVQWVMSRALQKTTITKEHVCPHTLRHSYATHLLEDGLDIVSIQQLLGHSHIETTMVYLHVMQPQGKKPHSPFDTLYGKA